MTFIWSVVQQLQAMIWFQFDVIVIWLVITMIHDKSFFYLSFYCFVKKAAIIFTSLWVVEAVEERKELKSLS